MSFIDPSKLFTSSAGMGHNGGPALVAPNAVPMFAPIPGGVPLAQQLATKAATQDGTLILTDATQIAMAEEYAKVCADKARIEKRYKVLNKMFKDTMGTHSVALAGTRVLTLSAVAETPATVITADMVGQTYGGRAAYNTLSVA